jgi:hypothetical protein
MIKTHRLTREADPDEPELARVCRRLVGVAFVAFLTLSS